MNYRRLSALLWATMGFLSVWATVPQGYYDSAIGKKGADLKNALYQKIRGHSSRSYNSLWSDFQSTDARNGKVWDMYSDIPNGTPQYTYNFGTNQCGNYAREGDCYNREHSFPKSWFNDASPMYSDLFHLYPTDGYVNNKRGNLPFGEVGIYTYISSNGSKVGKNTTSGYSGTVFEPIDEYKGDFARTYFYMATRYENLIANWANNSTEAGAVLAGNSYPAYKTWVVELLLKWHRQDPVSEKETNRNDAVYALQNNRNPFIDYPVLAEHIWGNKQNIGFQEEDTPTVNETFKALEATEITADAFTANWTAHSTASDYILNVYTIASQSGGEAQVIFSQDFGSELSSKIALDGYTSLTDEVGSVRLASGKKNGVIAISPIGTSGKAVLKVNAKRYGSDSDAIIYVNINGVQVGTITTTANYEDYEIILPAGAETATLSLTANAGKRVFVKSLSIETEGSTSYTSVLTGYPKNVGNVLNYNVTGLQPNTAYYYTVQPVGGTISAVIGVVTSSTSSVVAQQTKNIRLIHGVSGFYVNGLPSKANILIHSVLGIKLKELSNVSNGTFIALPTYGNYLITIDINGRKSTYKWVQ